MKLLIVHIVALAVCSRIMLNLIYTSSLHDAALRNDARKIERLVRSVVDITECREHAARPSTPRWRQATLKPQRSSCA